MSTILYHLDPDEVFANHQRWFPVLISMFMGLAIEIMEELNCMEQFFIKLQTIYSFICQVCFFILCDSAINSEDLSDLKGDKSVVIALTTILFYSVFAYFTSRLRDIFQSRSGTIQRSNSVGSYLHWLCKMILEWAKAVVVVLCLREQGIKYEPKLIYSVITFVYYLCTEKIFLELFPTLVETLNIEKLDNLEHLYIPLVLNVYAILAALGVGIFTMAVDYSNFVVFSLYFIVYLRVKDAYLNNWRLLKAEQKAYESFRVATQEDIDVWADICAVCLNNMSRARITPCNHFFHPYCLKQCLKSSFHCPLCKQHFNDQFREDK